MTLDWVRLTETKAGSKAHHPGTVTLRVTLTRFIVPARSRTVLSMVIAFMWVSFRVLSAGFLGVRTCAVCGAHQRHRGVLGTSFRVRRYAGLLRRGGRIPTRWFFRR